MECWGGRSGGSAGTPLPGGIWVKVIRPPSGRWAEKEPIMVVLLRHASRMKFLVCLSSAHKDMAHCSVNRFERRAGPYIVGVMVDPLAASVASWRAFSTAATHEPRGFLFVRVTAGAAHQVHAVLTPDSRTARGNAPCPPCHCYRT